MSKHISTLVEDIYSVIQGYGGWDATLSKELGEEVGALLDKRLVPTTAPATKAGLRMSNIGTPCGRKLWYSINEKGSKREYSAPLLMKFLQGDILEALLIKLAKAAGHTVTGEQDILFCHGIRGQRDCVIDGVTVDVKSASANAMKKFATNGLKTDDPFGYIRQLSGYVSAGKNDPLVLDKTNGAFLAIDKANGTIVLDMYDLTEEINSMPEHIDSLVKMTHNPSPPERTFKDVPEGKSGNYKLDTPCVFCEYKSVCWEELRAFRYAWGDIFLTQVVREPDRRIQEVPVG